MLPDSVSSIPLFFNALATEHEVAHSMEFLAKDVAAIVNEPPRPGLDKVSSQSDDKSLAGRSADGRYVAVAKTRRLLRQCHPLISFAAHVRASAVSHSLVSTFAHNFPAPQGLHCTFDDSDPQKVIPRVRRTA